MLCRTTVNNFFRAVASASYPSRRSQQSWFGVICIFCLVVIVVSFGCSFSSFCQEVFYVRNFEGFVNNWMLKAAQRKVANLTYTEGNFSNTKQPAIKRTFMHFIKSPSKLFLRKSGSISGQYPCRWSYKYRENINIAEQIAAGPFKLKLSATKCRGKFEMYVRYMSQSTVNRLCDNFNVSNLTSVTLKRQFLHCTGLEIYKHYLDSKGNLEVPKSFQNCKKMSFRNTGVATLLVSWPGSGNSWVRQLLESTTGIYTGSDRDCDVDYVSAGMLGEGITSESVIAVKVHYSTPHWKFKKAIYVVRNPYDAIVAEWNRGTLKAQRKSAPHISELNISRFGNDTKWKKFVEKSAVSWKVHVMKWFAPNRPFGSTILVVKYEDLLTDLRTQLIRMMKYLEYPYTEDDLNCTINSSTDVFHRNHTKSFEHYTPNELDVIYKQLNLANKFLKKYRYNISYDKHVLHM